MRVVVCALAKNEHLYINEWVNHYINLGVDKIFIYDNDDKNSKYIGDFIDKDLRDKVKIINVRGKHYKGIQTDLYTIFYNVEKDNYDWFIFCDIDEFLTGTNNIKNFLSNGYFGLFSQIRIRWKLFGDDNLIERDMSKGVMETFKEEKTSSLNWTLSKKGTLERQGKAIVRGHLKNVEIISPHYASNKLTHTLLPSCLPSGRLCQSLVSINEDYSHEKLFFNHYMTKSLCCLLYTSPSPRD